MKVTSETWEKLSNLLVKETRIFNKYPDWEGFTTSYWRINSDDTLRQVLDILGYDKEVSYEND